MDREDVNKLEPGVYLLYWKGVPGYPPSLAAVGTGYNGDRWIACADWISHLTVKHSASYWEGVERAVKIVGVHVLKNPELTDPALALTVNFVVGKKPPAITEKRGSFVDADGKSFKQFESWFLDAEYIKKAEQGLLRLVEYHVKRGRRFVLLRRYVTNWARIEADIDGERCRYFWYGTRWKKTR
jgi:hypothetical protein